MNAHSVRIDPHDLSSELNRRVVRAAGAMKERYGNTVPEAQRDQLLAFYVLGLTTPFYEDGPPASHLKAVRTHLLAALPPDRTDAAIDIAPSTEGDWFSGALKAIEGIGHKDGHALFMQCDDIRRMQHPNTEHRHEATPATTAGRQIN
ncbi:hypothetical protein [Ciceribacter sp. RN22]|uniref:hypothetical protein n=1 Tax=Ciceribacter sp. RN22 TaxID=2954932 RepID=UPI002091FEE4|nr:hypothetical protein [Ciceribacter sp. RN22]MCO6181013.1 hypothetical protein [Ciceribacter sp. RN22]